MNVPLVDQERKFAIRRAAEAELAVSFERRRLQFYLQLMVCDIAALMIAFLLAGYIYVGRGTGMIVVLLPVQLLIPIYLTIALQNGTYSLQAMKDWHAGALSALLALLVSAALLTFVAFFAKINAQFSRVGVLIGLVISAALLTGLRWAGQKLIRRRWGPTQVNVLIIDDGGPPIELPHAYRLEAARIGLQPSLDDPNALDVFARYIRNMDQVIVSCPPERRMVWAMVLKGCGVQGEVLFDYISEIGALGVVHRADIGITTLLVSTGPLGLRSRAMKRGLDLGVSLAALVVAVPILLAAVLAI
jgi:hypothetical protein